MLKAFICALLASASLAVKSSTLSSTTATTATHLSDGPEDETILEIIPKLIECGAISTEMVHSELEYCH